MHELVVPHPLAGPGVEAHKAVAVEILSWPVPTVEGVRRRRQGQIEVAELVIHSEGWPGADGPAELPGVIFPRLGSELPRPRHHMEGPTQTAGPRVIAPDVLRSSLPQHRKISAAPAAYDDHVANDDGS